MLNPMIKITKEIFEELPSICFLKMKNEVNLMYFLEMGLNIKHQNINTEEWGCTTIEVEPKKWIGWITLI